MLHKITRESLSELGLAEKHTVFIITQCAVSCEAHCLRFIVDTVCFSAEDFCFDGERGAISMHTDAFQPY